MGDGSSIFVVIKTILYPILFTFLLIVPVMLLVKVYPHLETFYKKYLAKDKKVEYFWLWPDIQNIDIAQAVAKDSSNVAFFVSFVTLIFALFQILGYSRLSIIDAILLVVIGFGIRHLSRIVSIAGLLIYGFSLANIIIINRGVINIVIAFMFISAFVNGVRACFSYHKLKASNIQMIEANESTNEKVEFQTQSEITPEGSMKLPASLKIAAGYMAIAGAFGLIMPLLNLMPEYTEFTAQSIAYKLGAYTREITFDALFLIAGIGLFLKKAWAKTLALIVLVVSAIYSANAFAWGFSGGPPSTEVYIASIGVTVVWNGILFYLIFKNRSHFKTKKQPTN